MHDAPHSDSYRVLVLGLDGGTFDLLLPWAADGHLPALARLLAEGAHSPLKSTIPPITPCAWSSFMTGMNPGKHGLFDFVEMLPDGRSFRFTNAASRRGETLWGRLSRAGRRVGVVNVPMTYPPETVNGYLISGLDTPHQHSRYTYPAGLRDELQSQGIDYHIDIQHLGDMRSDRMRTRRLEELCTVESHRTQALRYLAGRYPADFTMVVYTATDQVQHHFWHFMSPQHDKHDPRGAARFGHAIRDVYVHVDRLIASLLAGQDEQTVVIVMSDHGFGPTTNVRLRLNQALEQAGLLAFRREGRWKRTLRAMAGRGDGLLRSMLSHNVKRLLAGTFPKLRTWFEDLDEARIDWDHTTAYANEAYRSCPAVWLNRRAGPGGEVLSAEQIEGRLQAVENALRAIKDPQTGRPLVGNVYRTRDLYHGPLVDHAPDLILSWWEDAFLLEQSVPGGPRDSIVSHSTTPIEGGVEFAGSHRLEGVFMIAGGPARRNFAFSEACITDVAPTILYLMGLPIPADMDGRPLLAALDPDFVARHPPRHEEKSAAEPPQTAPTEAGFTEAEADLIAQRLRSMGYIE
ncbi:MAG: alkaline phosphatase family protein [Thermoguttaceae bacterium]|jgi:predicted AlkP superfamily phosphohydrolase/phosphomutase